jgi:large subunit ribosomal protein L17e
MREVAAALTGEIVQRLEQRKEQLTSVYAGMKLTKAYSYLSDVKDHKQVVPFRRFAGGVGRASQAKQFKTTRGLCLFRAISSSNRILTALLVYRTLAREVGQVHHSSTEERRIECGCQKH